jgi:hypothetical protein
MKQAIPMSVLAANTTTPAKPKAAAVVPIKAPKGIGFPGGYVSSAEDDRVNVVVNPPNGAKVLGGSDWQAFNKTLLEATLATIATTTNDPEAASNRLAAVAAALAGFKPVDELEGMIAGQCVALHFGAMECFRRALLPGQHPEVASKLRRDGANLCRAMTDMLEALDRKRGKGPQVVRVERVVVHEGGQAIVGSVQGGATPPPAPPLAIGQEEFANTMDDLVKQRELVTREGVV